MKNEVQRISSSESMNFYLVIRSIFCSGYCMPNKIYFWATFNPETVPGIWQMSGQEQYLLYCKVFHVSQYLPE